MQPSISNEVKKGLQFRIFLPSENFQIHSSPFISLEFIKMFFPLHPVIGSGKSISGNGLAVRFILFIDIQPFTSVIVTM